MIRRISFEVLFLFARHVAVVVINLKPMKVSNGVEDKTKGTSFIVMMTVAVQKTRTDAKG